MPSPVTTAQNPEGVDDFDPMDDPEYAAGVQSYSDKFRRLRGRPSIRLWDPEPPVEFSLNAYEMQRDPGETDQEFATRLDLFRS